MKVVVLVSWLVECLHRFMASDAAFDGGWHNRMEGLCLEFTDRIRLCENLFSDVTHVSSTRVV